MVDCALECIDHSASALVFEILCDFIGDFDVLLAADEHVRVLSLVGEMGLKLSARYLYIKPGDG